LSSRLLPARRTVAHWIAAAFTAAAIVYVPIFVILLTENVTRSARETALWSPSPCSAAAIAVHPDLPFPFGVQLAAIAVASTLSVLAGVGVLFMILLGGSCSESDHGHLQLGGWISAVAVYAGIATWGVQRPLRTAWAVPVAILFAGLWLVALASVLTGSTGACLE
jgi:hypothetical protein